jgi:S1-C subfamily serine protease
MASCRFVSRFVLLLVVVAAGFEVVVSASPVIDDVRLAKQFVAGLGPLASSGRTLKSEGIRESLAAKAGATVDLPQAATPCSLEPDRPLYDAVVPAIVTVGSVYKCEKCSDWHIGGLATGWVLSPDGLVVTNHHVLERDKGHSFGVMASDGTVFAIEEVVATDPAGDAAIIRIATGGRQLPHLAIGRPSGCGEPVSVISHPRGRFYCLTEGVVSRYHRQKGAVWMSVTADYAVGSSGGPVFNAAGEVVGMVSRTFNPPLPNATAKPGDAAQPQTQPQPKSAPAVPDQMVFIMQPELREARLWF